MKSLVKRTARAMKNLPMTTHVTKWSIDGRVLGKPPSNRTSTASLHRKPKERPKPKETVSEGRVKMYGSQINFNHNDMLGPWKTKGLHGFIF